MAVDYAKLRNRYKSYQEQGGIIEDEQDVRSKQVISLKGYENVKFWKPEAGTHMIDILPYMVSGKNHPQGLKEGDIDYLLDVWVHRSIGPARDNYLCKAKHGMGPCPLCDEFNRLKNEKLDAKKDEMGMDRLPPDVFKAVMKDIDYLQPKRRVYYNVIDLAAPAEGIQLWEAPFSWSEKEIVKHFTTKKDIKPGTPYFWQHDEGLSVVISSTKEEYSGRKFVKSIPVGFEDRDEQYSDDIIEKTYRLDSMLTIPNFDDMMNSLHGIITRDDDEEEAKEETVEEAPNVDVPKVESKAERLAKIKAKKKAEEEKPADPTCPEGGEFGEDIGGFDACESCEFLEACAEKAGADI